VWLICLINLLFCNNTRFLQCSFRRLSYFCDVWLGGNKTVLTWGFFGRNTQKTLRITVRELQQVRVWGLIRYKQNSGLISTMAQNFWPYVKIISDESSAHTASANMRSTEDIQLPAFDNIVASVELSCRPEKKHFALSQCAVPLGLLWIRGEHWQDQYPAGQARNQGGAYGAFAPPEIFKTLHSNFDICRNF